MRYSLVTKALHALLALSIVHQLLVSLIMDEPKFNRPIETPFLLHQWVGITSLVIVVAFWLWTLARRGESSFGAFLPWFSSARRQAVLADLRAYAAALPRLKLPDSAAHTAFANAVHGLGLLIGSFMAVTGLVIYLQMTPEGRIVGIGHLMKELHETGGTLMWIYLIGHGAMALLHQLMGEKILRKMWTISG